MLLVLAAAPIAAFGQVRVGPEFRVNSYTTADQIGSRVAADAAGNFLVVWQSSGQDGSNWGVFARWHDAAGAPLGAGEFRVNAATAGYQGAPAMASAPDGAMVVAWTRDGLDGGSADIHARRYASAIVPPGPEFVVNAYTTSFQSGASVAMDAAGNPVVAWFSFGPDDAGTGVFGRRFDTLGSPRGGDFHANSHTTSVQELPAVASDAAGNFVVVWHSFPQDGSQYGVYAQRYDATGARVGGEFRINTFTMGHQRNPDVAADPQGSFVVVWVSNQDGHYDVWGRRYDAGGTPQSDAFRVNLHTTGRQHLPSVAVDAEGAFVVVWEGDAPDGSGSGVFGRRYDSSGTPDSYEFPLNAHAPGDQRQPRVAMDGQGNFVTTWSSEGQDGSGHGIFAQRFRPDLIFRDGFEDGTVGAWSASATDGGDLSISPLAGLKFTTAGLQGVVDDTAGLYVQDDRPQDERSYRARFYFDPNGFDPGEALAHRRIRIFLAFSEAPTRRVAAVVLRRVNGEYGIRCRARRDDNSQADTPFMPITDGPHFIEIDLKRATAPAAGDGALIMVLDGTPFVMPLDNSLTEVDFVRLGALSVKAGANGTMYWDEFESRRHAVIGP